MKKLFAILFIIHFSLFTNQCTAQGKYNNNWVTGATFSYIVNFDSTYPKVTWLDTTGKFVFVASHSNISDSLGNLILMCSGSKVYNSSKQIIENGDTLIDNLYYAYKGGNPILGQGSAIILPFENNIYFEVNPTITDANWSTTAKYDRLYLHKVDLLANSGLGKMTETKIISDSILFSWVGMTACRHANGIDWWLAKQGAGLGSNDMYTFLITKDSFSVPHKFTFAEPKYNNFDRSGQLVFNQQATKIANVSEQPNQVFVADFDRCYGTISNPKVYNIPALLIDSFFSDTALERLPSGLCFSPNGQFLYVMMRSKIFQLDITEPDSALAWYLVASLDTTGAAFFNYYTLQLGPDNKIYTGKWGGFNPAWNIIEKPDLKGASCGWCRMCLRFPKAVNAVAPAATSPPNTINLNLGAISPPCAPMLVNNNTKTIVNLSIYPNPVENTLQLQLPNYNKKAVLQIDDAQGKTIINNEVYFVNGTAYINVNNLASGVYILKINISGEVVTRKFVKK